MLRAVAIPCLVACLVAMASGGEAPPHPAVAASGVGSGLCVVVGARPAAELTALSNGGRMLVECLVADRGAADRLRGEIDRMGLTGLVTVEHHPEGQPLPYAANIVNLLIADRADPAEARRVLAPLGASVIAGKPERIPLPPEMDEWPQANRDAEQSNWSRDALVGPVMGFRWIATQHSNRAIASIGGPQKVTLRLVGGRQFTFIAEPDADDRRLRQMLECRDAFSGVRIWARPVDLPNQSMHAQFVLANADRVYTYPGRTEPLTCYDARTGEVLRTLPPPVPLPAMAPPPGNNVPRNDPRSVQYQADLEANSRQFQCAQVIQVKDVLLVQRCGWIVAYREADGTLLWQRHWPDVRVMAASVAGSRIMLVQELLSVNLPAMRGAGEGPFVNRVVGLDLASGDVAWTRTDATGEYLGYVMQPPLVHGDRAVIVSKLADYPGPKRQAAPNTQLPAGFQFVCLDPATGATRWSDRTKDVGGRIDANIWWTVGSFVNARGELWIGYVGDNTGIDVGSGAMIRSVPSYGTNCFWNRGVGDWKTAGFHWFHTVSNKHLVQGGVRPGCNDGLFFGYGATYSYNHLCACSKWIIGGVAMTSGPLPTPLPDKVRLEVFAPLQPGPEGRPGWRDLMGDAHRSGRVAGRLPPAAAALAWRTPAARALPAGPVADDWGNDPTVRAVGAPVMADGVVVAAHGNAHALVAHDAATGTLRWRTVLGGRIDAPPVLWRGHAFVGCRDGWVYALSLADGSVRWRHLVASDRRQLVSGGQLESLWPVLGSVIIHDGALYACAGRTCQYDGGLWVTRIDPVTGSSAWRSRILSTSGFHTAVRNEPLAVIGGRLWMDKMSLDPATGRSIDEVLVANGTIDREGRPIPKTDRKPRTFASPRLEDPRDGVATNGGYNAWHGYPGAPFAGFSGSLHTIMHPGCRTNHRGGTVGSWTTDERGHYRLGTGGWARKGNSGRVGGLLTAWAPDDPLAGDERRSKPLWTNGRVGSGAAMAMDEERIVIATSGESVQDPFLISKYAGSQGRLEFYQRSDGAAAGSIVLPHQVVWRGIAAADGAMAIAFEDGSIGLWK